MSDKVNLDILSQDESLEDSANLPAPDIRDLFSQKPSSSVLSRQRSVLLRPKGVAFAFRTGVCDRSRDRSCEMLHVSAGSTFPAERSQFGFAREKC